MAGTPHSEQGPLNAKAEVSQVRTQVEKDLTPNWTLSAYLLGKSVQGSQSLQQPGYTTPGE